MSLVGQLTESPGSVPGPGLDQYQEMRELVNCVRKDAMASALRCFSILSISAACARWRVSDMCSGSEAGSYLRLIDSMEALRCASIRSISAAW